MKTPDLFSALAQPPADLATAAQASQPLPPQPEPPRQLDSVAAAELHQKTLAVVRRLLLGNGWNSEDISLAIGDHGDIKLTAKLDLTCVPEERAKRVSGKALGPEGSNFTTRAEAKAYLEQAAATYMAGDSWKIDAYTTLQQQPNQGWGHTQLTLPTSASPLTASAVLACDTCHGQGIEVCRTCGGQREMVCQNCGGRGCSVCQQRGQVFCTSCDGSGRLTCKACNGAGHYTETAAVRFKVEGAFTYDYSAAPTNIAQLLEHMGPATLTDGHALITLQPVGTEVGSSLHYTARLPFGHFTLQLQGHPYPFSAFGHAPLLADFPFVLDAPCSWLCQELTDQNILELTSHVRLLKELVQAFAQGVDPRAFYTKNYPYGLSPAIALQLATQVREILQEVSFMPRLVGALAVGVPAMIGYFFWLSNPRPEFLPYSVPIWVWDCGLAAIMMIACMAAVAFAGQKALSKLLQQPISLRTGGGLMMLWSGLGLTVILAFLLLFPYTRPEWVYSLLP